MANPDIVIKGISYEYVVDPNSGRYWEALPENPVQSGVGEHLLHWLVPGDWQLKQSYRTSPRDLSPVVAFVFLGQPQRGLAVQPGSLPDLEALISIPEDELRTPITAGRDNNVNILRIKPKRIGPLTYPNIEEGEDIVDLLGKMDSARTENVLSQLTFQQVVREVQFSRVVVEEDGVLGPQNKNRHNVVAFSLILDDLVKELALRLVPFSNYPETRLGLRARQRPVNARYIESLTHVRTLPSIFGE